MVVTGSASDPAQVASSGVQMLEADRHAFTQNEWNEVVSRFQDLSIMQTWEYGEAKADVEGWRTERCVFRQGDEIAGAVQALVRTVPLMGGGIAWINQGPLWKRSTATDASTLVPMLDEIKRRYVEAGIYLRLAPTLTANDLTSLRGQVAGYRVLRETEGWHSSRVDLTRPLAEIRAGFARKWRGDLNAAERRGAIVRSDQAASTLARFLDNYSSFVEQRNITTRLTPRFLTTLQELLPPLRKMWVFEGQHEAQHLGGLLVTTYGDTALALAGSNPTERGRELRSGNLVWWSAIKEMKSLGYRWLDVGGTSPSLTSKGILHFKAGLNGEPTALMHECEAARGSLTDRFIRWYLRKNRK